MTPLYRWWAYHAPRWLAQGLRDLEFRFNHPKWWFFCSTLDVLPTFEWHEQYDALTDTRSETVCRFSDWVSGYWMHD